MQQKICTTDQIKVKVKVAIYLYASCVPKQYNLQPAKGAISFARSFAAAQHGRPLTGTKLRHLMTETHLNLPTVTTQ